MLSSISSQYRRSIECKRTNFSSSANLLYKKFPNFFAHIVSLCAPVILKLSDYQPILHIIIGTVYVGAHITPQIWLILVLFVFCGATAQIGLRVPHCWGIYVTHNYTPTYTHTHTRTYTHTHTHGSTPLNQWSPVRQAASHTTHNTQQTHIKALSGNRTRDPSKRLQT